MQPDTTPTPAPIGADARAAAYALLEACERDWPSTPRHRAAVLKAAYSLRLALADAAAPKAAPAAQGDAEDAAFEAVRQRLCEIPRYSFVLDDDGVMRRVQGRAGDWIEFDAAYELFEPVAVDADRAAKEGGA